VLSAKLLHIHKSSISGHLRNLFLAMARVTTEVARIRFTPLYYIIGVLVICFNYRFSLSFIVLFFKPVFWLYLQIIRQWQKTFIVFWLYLQIIRQWQKLRQELLQCQILRPENKTRKALSVVRICNVISSTGSEGARCMSESGMQNLWCSKMHLADAAL